MMTMSTKTSTAIPIMATYSSSRAMIVDFVDRIMALDDEYVAMIGMAVLVFVLMVIITVCRLCRPYHGSG